MEDRGEGGEDWGRLGESGVRIEEGRIERERRREIDYADANSSSIPYRSMSLLLPSSRLRSVRGDLEIGHQGPKP